MKLRYSNFADRIDINAFEEAIEFEPLDSAKGEDRGYCPLPWDMHKNGDTTGKFSIQRDKLVYNCWVCGGGSLLSLTMAVKDMDVEEATEWLYQFTKEEDGSDDALDRIDEQYRRTASKAAPYFNPMVLSRWEEQAPTLLSWYEQRGISVETGRRFQVGLDPAHTKRGKAEPYAGPAIILPHFFGGKLVGWQERWLGDRPKWLGKYTNTPDFPREWTLWGYDEAIRADKIPIVVESVATALRLWSLGLPAIATFGSNVSERQMKLLRGFINGIYLAPDNDAPGEKWLDDMSRYLDHYLSVMVMLPNGEEGSDLGDVPEAAVFESLGRAVLL